MGSAAGNPLPDMGAFRWLSALMKTCTKKRGGKWGEKWAG